MVVRYEGAPAATTSGATHSSFTGNGTIGEAGVTYQVYRYLTPGTGYTFDLTGVNMAERLQAEIASDISGSGDFRYAGPAGTVILSGNNTYTGSTTIDAGTLVVNGSLSGTSEVTVKSGAILSGNGSIGGDVTFESGSTLLTSGTLNIAGTVTIESGVTLDFTSSSSLLLTYDAIDGEFDPELNIPQGWQVEYGANELRLIPPGATVFRFR